MFKRAKAVIASYEQVLWYDADGSPRRAMVNRKALDAAFPWERDKRPPRYTHDNAKARILWLMISTGVGAFFGLLLGLLVTFTQIIRGSITPEVLTQISALVTTLGMAGFLIGRKWVVPKMLTKPLWLIRMSGAAPSGIFPDITLAQKFRMYFIGLHHDLAEKAGEEVADRVVPAALRAASEPIAPFDARTLYYKEEMRDEARHVRGWEEKKDRAQLLKVGGIFGIALLSVIVFTIIISNTGGDAAPASALWSMYG